jgi:hypothetical protein
MIDHIRRNMLATGAAATAVAAAPQVFAQQAGQGLPSSTKKARFESRIRRSAPAFRCWRPGA